MQKLIYQNILGEQAEFFHAPFVLCKVRGVGMSDVKVTAVSGALQQGESIAGLCREGRQVKLTLHLMASDRRELYRLRSRLLEILSADRAFGGTDRARLIYENDYGRRWTWAAPESGLDWGERKQNVQPSLSLTFRCQSPYWYSIGRSETLFRARENGLTLPMGLPLRLGSKVFSRVARNNGQADTPVLVTIAGQGEMPALINDRTGAELRLVSALPAGDVLTVNTDPAELRVTITRANGTVENGFGLLSPESAVTAFVLKPGDNTLRYVPDGDLSQSVIGVSWYDRFEGV